MDARVILGDLYRPEVAHVGLSEAEAKARVGNINVLRWPYHENDRAQAERLATRPSQGGDDKKGRILGATIVGPSAGELIQVWSLAIAQKMNIQAMTSWIAPYPTLGEVSKRAAIRYYAGTMKSSLA